MIRRACDFVTHVTMVVKEFVFGQGFRFWIYFQKWLHRGERKQDLGFKNKLLVNISLTFNYRVV